MLTWFQHRHRKVFHRLSMLERFEKLVSDNREKLAPKNIRDIFGLLIGLKAGPRRIPAILTGFQPITSDYKSLLVSLFDPYIKERTEWSNEAALLRRQINDLDNTPWHNPTPKAMRERHEEMGAVSASLVLVDNKLAGIPPQNTFAPVELYHFDSNEELQARGFITEIDGTYPRFTEKGLKVYETAEEMFRYVSGKLHSIDGEMAEKSLQDLQNEVWKRMRSAYVQ